MGFHILVFIKHSVKYLLFHSTNVHWLSNTYQEFLSDPGDAFASKMSFLTQEADLLVKEERDKLRKRRENAHMVRT